MKEIVQGILNAMHPRVHGMVAEKTDFVHELRCFSENGELYLQTGLQAIILVTRSQGVSQ